MKAMRIIRLMTAFLIGMGIVFVLFGRAFAEEATPSFISIQEISSSAQSPSEIQGAIQHYQSLSDSNTQEELFKVLKELLKGQQVHQDLRLIAVQAIAHYSSDPRAVTVLLNTLKNEKDSPVVLKLMEQLGEMVRQTPAEEIRKAIAEGVVPYIESALKKELNSETEALLEKAFSTLPLYGDESLAWEILLSVWKVDKDKKGFKITHRLESEKLRKIATESLFTLLGESRPETRHFKLRAFVLACGIATDSAEEASIRLPFIVFLQEFSRRKMTIQVLEQLAPQESPKEVQLAVLELVAKIKTENPQLEDPFLSASLRLLQAALQSSDLDLRKASIELIPLFPLQGPLLVSVLASLKEKGEEFAPLQQQLIKNLNPQWIQSLSLEMHQELLRWIKESYSKIAAKDRVEILEAFLKVRTDAQSDAELAAVLLLAIEKDSELLSPAFFEGLVTLQKSKKVNLIAPIEKLLEGKADAASTPLGQALAQMKNLTQKPKAKPKKLTAKRHSKRTTVRPVARKESKSKTHKISGVREKVSRALAADPTPSPLSEPPKESIPSSE